MDLVDPHRNWTPEARRKAGDEWEKNFEEEIKFFKSFIEKYKIKDCIEYWTKEELYKKYRQEGLKNHKKIFSKLPFSRKMTHSHINPPEGGGFLRRTLNLKLPPDGESIKHGYAGSEIIALISIKE